MLHIPNKYVNDLKTILKWHLEFYSPDFFFDTRIKRILERIENNDAVELEEKELYYICECASNAKNYAPECGVERSVAEEIFDWIYPIYQKTKTQQK